MAENLAYLPSVNNLTESSTTDPRYYVLEYNGNDVDEAKTHTAQFYWYEQTIDINCFEKYGVLYNQPAALALCPEGWRLPTKEDWEYLGKYVATNYVDNQDNDGGIALKSISGWDLTSSPDGKNGTNSSGFNGLPGSWAEPASGLFQGNLRTGAWWSQSTLSSNSETWVYVHSLSSYNDISKVAYGNDLDRGRSVRYVKVTLPI
jgi:uncharacterized protein (TIGR02145 family)